MGMVYEWSDSRAFKVPAQAVGEEVEVIAAEVGECSPRAFWQRTQTMRTHFDQYTVDEHADLHRDVMARRVLNSLRVVQVIDNRTHDVPAFLSVSMTSEEGQREGRGYRPVGQVMADPDMRNQALAEARRQLNALRRRYGHLKEFAEVWSAIDEAVDVAA